MIHRLTGLYSLDESTVFEAKSRAHSSTFAFSLWLQALFASATEKEADPPLIARRGAFVIFIPRAESRPEKTGSRAKGRENKTASYGIPGILVNVAVYRD